MSPVVLYAVCAAVILLIVRELKPEYALLGGVFVSLSIVGVCVKEFARIIGGIGDYSAYGVNEYIGVMLKVAGICIFADVGADICAACGFPSVSKGVLIFGKTQLLLTVLPYVDLLIKCVGSLF